MQPCELRPVSGACGMADCGAVGVVVDEHRQGFSRACISMSTGREFVVVLDERCDGDSELRREM